MALSNFHFILDCGLATSGSKSETL